MEKEKPTINNSENGHLKGISTIFNNKGILGPIAEKACNNFKLKKTHAENKMQRVHYFAVGHAFKHIDTKTLFKYELDDKEKVEVPTAYLALQRAEFTFTNELFNLLSNIRNLNSHYVHRFDKLDLSVINNDVILFLKQAFKLSLVQAYQLEKEILPASEKHLVAFILPMFYPLKDVKKNSNNEWLDHNIAWNTYVKTLGLKSLDEIIEMLLFIEVETSFKWSIDNSLEIFELNHYGL